MNKYFVKDIGIWGENDRFIKDVIINEEYKFLFSYDTVIDIGANIGTFSLWIYPHAKRIYAVEPNPKAMMLLEKTVADNNLEKIYTVEAAITGTGGTRLLKNTDDPLKQYGSGEINDTEGLTVKSYSIDAFMDQNNIEYVDLIKVDIEGGEVELFESEGFRNVAPKIGTIIGEYHDGSRRAKIIPALEASSFRYIDQGTHFIAKHR